MKESPESDKDDASAHGHGSASHEKPASSLPRDNRKFGFLFHMSLPFVHKKREQAFLFLFA